MSCGCDRWHALMCSTFTRYRIFTDGRELPFYVTSVPPGTEYLSPPFQRWGCRDKNRSPGVRNADEGTADDQTKMQRGDDIHMASLHPHGGFRDSGPNWSSPTDESVDLDMSALLGLSIGEDLLVRASAWPNVGKSTDQASKRGLVGGASNRTFANARALRTTRRPSRQGRNISAHPFKGGDVGYQGSSPGTDLSVKGRQMVKRRCAAGNDVQRRHSYGIPSPARRVPGLGT